MEQIKLKIYKLAWAIIQLAITFFIKIYIMNAVSITGNSKIDKIIFSCVSIVLIILTIKNFIDISISKKDRIKLSVWHQLLIFGALVVLACLIWWLMNYELFWIFLVAFVVSYIIVFFKSFGDLRLINRDKKELKRILEYNYDLKIDRLKRCKDDERIFTLGKSKEILIVIIKSTNLSNGIVNDIIDDYYKIEVLLNEEGESFSQIKDNSVIIFKNSQISDIIKLANQLQDRCNKSK